MAALIDQFSLALDSALCCLALGAALPARNTRRTLAMMFGLCDLGASLLALLPMPHAPMPPAAVYLCFAMLLGIGARSHPRLAWAAPLLLSLDNLSAASSVPDALAAGAGSALFAWAALCAGAWLGHAAIVDWRHER